MKNKKFISAVTALMLTASLMAGCSDKPAEDSSPASDSSSAAATTTSVIKKLPQKKPHLRKILPTQRPPKMKTA